MAKYGGPGYVPSTFLGQVIRPEGTGSMRPIYIIAVTLFLAAPPSAPAFAAEDRDEAVAALEFYKSMREFCPVGATGYSWGESLTAFVSGATATGLYSGRVLINATRQNPRIADHITCTTYPRISTDVEPWTYNDYPGVFIPADAPEKELTRKFAAWLFKTDGYIRQVNATPGHVLPVIESVARDSRYLDSPVIRRYESEVSAMSVAAAEGRNLGWETSRHKPNTRAGAVIQSGVLAEMVQRVALNDEKPRTVLGDTARKIEAIMKY